MRTITTARIGATGAGALLALGLFAAAPPAGASGTHGVNSATAACFTATGQTQGRSHSDPDGMSNGGADKPGCTGGFDADRDGNNGCGNDADREDDNNGNCGRKAQHDEGGDAASPPSSTTTTSTTTTTTTRSTAPVSVAPTAEVGTGELTDCQVDPKEAEGCPTVSAAAAGNGATPGVEVSGSTAGATTGIAANGTGAADDSGPSVTAPGTEVLGLTLSRSSALARTGAGVGGMALLGGLLCGGGRFAVLARRLLRIG